ncbi:hypothetical protein XENOCAPTIV_023332, partial [Xenoophorus captivus]
DFSRSLQSEFGRMLNCLSLHYRAYLLYDRSLNATGLHRLLQNNWLLGLLNDVLSPIGSTHHLQDLT